MKLGSGTAVDHPDPARSVTAALDPRVLPALGANALLVHDGDLWVAGGRVDAVQRFDLPRSP
jgi:hypothetical protein